MENKLIRILAVLLISYPVKGQIGSFKLPSKIDLDLSSKVIIHNILKDETVQIIRVDTLTEVFPSIVYKTPLMDSVSLVFHRENFSIMRMYFNDSCYFLYAKAFCLENLKMSKKSKNSKKQLFFAKHYNITLFETWSIKQQVIIIRSKKHPIHI